MPKHFKMSSHFITTHILHCIVSSSESLNAASVYLGGSYIGNLVLANDSITDIYHDWLIVIKNVFISIIDRWSAVPD